MTNEFKIDKDVPMPSRRAGGRKYPFVDLGIGDSFFVPDVTKRGSLANCVSKHRPKIFTVRLVTENGVTGIRVWRTA